MVGFLFCFWLVGLFPGNWKDSILAIICLMVIWYWSIYSMLSNNWKKASSDCNFALFPLTLRFQPGVYRFHWYRSSWIFSKYIKKQSQVRINNVNFLHVFLFSCCLRCHTTWWFFFVVLFFPPLKCLTLCVSYSGGDSVADCLKHLCYWFAFWAEVQDIEMV